MILFKKFFGFQIDADNLSRRREQVRARILLYPDMVLPAMGISVLLVVLLWDAVAHDRLLLWLALVWSWHGVELLGWWRHRRAADTLQQCRAWHRRFMWHTGVAALGWGAAGVLLFVPGAVAYQALLVCVLVGMAAGAAVTNAVHRPSLLLYLSLLLLPIIVRLALEGDRLHGGLAALLVIYLGFLLHAASRIMRVFEAFLREHFENERLLQMLHKRKQELAAALQRAEQANREKSRFLAAASHDLRQPMQALRLFTETLQSAAREPHIAKLAEQIGKSVQALSDMFEDLLDLSRLEAGIIQPRLQHFELNDLFERLFVDFEPLARAKGLTCKLASCPPCAQAEVCSGVAYSDPFLLERMLRNLLANAIRYTDQGEVTLSCEWHSDRMELAVCDTGIGIRPEALPHIFEEYYQVDNPHRDRRKGLGLGLAIVRRIEGLLGCKVEVRSVPGQGSCFSFSVPSGDPAQLVRPFVITQSRYDLQGKVVALVDDDEEVRTASTQLMEEWGCRVYAAGQGDELLRLLDRDAVRPDILVCDYRLPQGQTALDVRQALRQFWGEVPTVVVTGDTGAEVLRTLRQAGVALLNKPVVPLRLRAEMYYASQGAGAAKV